MNFLTWYDEIVNLHNSIYLQSNSVEIIFRYEYMRKEREAMVKNTFKVRIAVTN